MPDFKVDIDKALEVLHNGGVILYPTDTFWAIGCDATNSNAVERVFKIIKHVGVNTTEVLIDSAAKLNGLVSEIPDMAWELIEVSEKPLTIVYPDARNLAPQLIAKDKSANIRVTREAFSKTLCGRFRKPIVAASANVIGKTASANFKSISTEILNAVDFVVRYRQDDTSESTNSSVIQLDKGNVFRIIRE